MRVSPPYRVYGVAGGITVSRADGEGGMLRIYDIGGNLLVEEEAPADGAFYMLSPGVYIVTAGGGRPLKLTVR